MGGTPIGGSPIWLAPMEVGLSFGIPVGPIPEFAPICPIGEGAPVDPIGGGGPRFGTPSPMGGGAKCGIPIGISMWLKPTGGGEPPPCCRFSFCRRLQNHTHRTDC